MQEIMPGYYLITVGLAWFIAQTAKYVIGAIRAQNFADLRLMYQSGNMPSAHAAVVTSVTTAIMLQEGANSPLFALALVLSTIVLYDAVQVRHSVGEQGTVLQEVVKKVLPGKKVHVALGHTILEVAVGSAIGISVAFFITTFS